jgi:ABC-2 type transport system permease protein
MYRLLLKSFFRSKIFLISLVLLMVVGVISILIGKQYLIQQENAIVAAQKFQKESIKSNLEYHNDDLGLLLYYLRFTFMKKPATINAISIGQSDVNPSLQSVTIRALEGQKYDPDFKNPSLLMTGNLDVGFVIIYMFPLVLIAMTFNLYSEEKELGTWPLIAMQTSNKSSFLFKKLMIRVLFTLFILAMLLFAASAYLQIPLDQNFWAISLQSILYLCFWSAVCLWIISLFKSSMFNALTLISIWVVLTILIPAIANNYLIQKHQIPDALRVMIEQRDGYHEKWDLEKNAAMTGFLKAYPQFEKYAVPEAEFSWIWYYAMQHMGDVSAKNTTNEMMEKVMLRNTISEKIALFVPTIHAQLSLNNLAGTDMMSHFEFLTALKKFHEHLRLEFYNKIFDNMPANVIDWNTHEAKFYNSKPNNFRWMYSMSPTIFRTLTICFLGGLNLRRL